MQFNPGTDRRGRDAGADARRELAHLPATVHAFILVELQKWPTLFGPEQRYQRALLEHLSRLPKPELDQRNRGGSRGSRRQAGVNSARERNPVAFQDEAQALLRKRGLRRLAQRSRRLSSRTSTRRSRPGSIPPMRRGGSSSRSMAAASRSSARNCGAASKAPVSASRSTWTARAAPTISPGAVWRAGARPRRAGVVYRPAAPSPLDAWLIESHEALHAPAATPGPATTSRAAPTGLSYDRLRPIATI